MATSTKREVSVETLSKFGFKSNGVYINWSKNIQEGDKGKVVPGATYLMDIYTADSGKEYVNKVLSQTQGNTATTPDVAPQPKFNAPVLVSAKPKATESGLSKDEWAQKDQRISRQGAIQAAVKALAPVVSEELLFAKASALAEQMLGFVNAK